MVFFSKTPQQSIDHTGLVASINGRMVTVKIQPQASCGACGAKSICNMADETGKNVEVLHDDAFSLKPGQEVTISLERSMGYQALLLGYMLPLVILVSSLFILVHLLADEGIAAMFSLLILGIYYTILYFFRSKIGSRFVFRIKK
jgi:sigma-E factor negative regulatory protein RseC